MPSRWHKEAPAPARTMSRAPHCLSHGLSNEGNDSCEIMPAHEKFVSGISGAIKCLYRARKQRGKERGGGWWTGRGEEDGGLDTLVVG